MEGRLKVNPQKAALSRLLLIATMLLNVAAFLLSCGGKTTPQEDAIEKRDSMPVLVTHGVSKLISDSGVVRYKIIAEEWRVFDKTQPPRQEFKRGVILQRFDEKFKVNLFITADTAFCYDNNLWELRGRVFIKNYETATVFRTEELFWNMGEHRFYNHRYMYIRTPDREIEGDSFSANESLTKFEVFKSRGFMPRPHERTSTPGAAPVDSVSIQQAQNQGLTKALTQ